MEVQDRINERSKERAALHIHAKETLKAVAEMLTAMQPSAWLPSVEERRFISESQVKDLWRDYINKRADLLEKAFKLNVLLLDDLTEFMKEAEPHDI